MPRKLASLAAAGAATVLALAACAGDETGEDGATGAGFEDCQEEPNTCNSGERADGGEITWLIDFNPGAYFTWSPEGGSVAGLMAIEGILPNTGIFLPDGEYEFNMDTLSAEPELLSEDPFTYQFQFNPDAVWEDGTTPVNADNMVLLWKMSTSEDEGQCEGCVPRSSESFDIIESVESSDDGLTATITLKEGNSDPEWFTFGGSDGIIGGLPPVHVGIEQGFIEGGPDDWDPAGLGEYFEYLDQNVPEFSAGPYMIESWELDEQVVMVPNPNWYGEVEPTLDRIVKIFNDAEDTWVPAVQNGELQGGSPGGASFNEDVITQLEELDNVRMHIQPGPAWAHLDLNLDNEWLGEHQALRQAIFTAIDADEIANRLFGSLYPDYTVRTNHLFGQDSQYHVDQTTESGQGTGDVERARQLLADAGFEGYDEGAGSLTFEGEEVGPFRLRSGISPLLTTATELEQAQLAEIGVEVTIETTDDLGATLGGQDYDLMQFSWSGSPAFVGDGAQFWATGSGSNFGSYSNDQLDALVEQEQQATTLDESAALHNQMMEIVVDDAYVLPLYDSPVFIFVTDDYINVRDNSNTSLRGIYSQGGWGLAASE